ncbi:MAG: alpha/beta fold hydrolase [Eubacteriales bacterium]|nr:alpha/beta fold hydrolase [Eubacteriales bacterium]
MFYYNNQSYYPGTNGKAVLFIHGITSGSAQGIPYAEYLNDYGYGVSLVNLAGHGTYPEDLLHTEATDFIYKAEFDYKQLKAMGYEKIFISGLSTGGLLSLVLAARHPEIAGIIPISAPMAMVPGNFISDEYPPDQVYYHRDPGGKTGVAKKYHVHYEDIAVKAFQSLRDLIDIVRNGDILPEVRCPACIIQAKDDNMAEPDSSVYINEHISSDDKMLCRPEIGGHNIILGEQRFAAFEKALEFLEQH